MRFLHCARGVRLISLSLLNERSRCSRFAQFANGARSIVSISLLPNESSSRFLQAFKCERSRLCSSFPDMMKVSRLGNCSNGERSVEPIRLSLRLIDVVFGENCSGTFPPFFVSLQIVISSIDETSMYQAYTLPNNWVWSVVSNYADTAEFAGPSSSILARIYCFNISFFTIVKKTQ